MLLAEYDFVFRYVRWTESHMMCTGAPC